MCMCIKKIEFVTVNQNSLNYGGGKIVFHRSLVKTCFVFRNPHCPIVKTVLRRLQLRIMSGPAGIRLQSVLSGCPAGQKFSCPVHLYSLPLLFEQVPYIPAYKPPFLNFWWSKVWVGGLYDEHKTKTVFSEPKFWHSPI